VWYVVRKVERSNATGASGLCAASDGAERQQLERVCCAAACGPTYLACATGVEDLKPHCAMIVTAYRSCTNPREMMESYYKTLCGILCHAVHSGPAKGETVNVSQLGSADACVIGEFARGLGFRVAELDTDGVEGDEEQFSFPPVKSGES